MLKWIALAAGLLLAACQTTNAPPAHATTFGIQCVSANTCPVALVTAQNTLGAKVARMGASYPLSAGQKTAVANYIANGNTLFLSFDANCGQYDDATFLADLQASWAQLQGYGVTPQNVYAASYYNEVDDPVNPQGCTIAQYLHDFDTVFIPWAHSAGLKATDSGITYTGLEVAYFYSTAKCTTPTTCTPTIATDQFYSQAMKPGVFANNLVNLYCSSNNPCVSAVPTTCSPSTNFTTNYLNRLASVQTLLADFAVDGEDYTNFHWFWAGASPIALMMPWLYNQTHQPLLTAATGTSSQSGIDLQNVLAAEAAQGAQLILWYVPDGQGGGASTGLLNDDGTLRPNGVAFKNYISSNPPPSGYGASAGAPIVPAPLC